MFKIYFSNTKIVLHIPKHTQDAMNVFLCLTLVLFENWNLKILFTCQLFTNWQVNKILWLEKNIKLVNPIDNKNL